ncbi:unnamed protein product [Gordionus sp. m RMFG-2023]
MADNFKPLRPNFTLFQYTIYLSIILLTSVEGWKWLTLANIGSVLYNPNAIENLDIHDQELPNDNLNLNQIKINNNQINDISVSYTKSNLKFLSNNFIPNTNQFKNDLDVSTYAKQQLNHRFSRYYLFDSQMCRRKDILSKIDLEQIISVCQRNPEDLELFQSIHKGASIALTECQNQFQDRRWNCTLFQANQPKLGSLFPRQTISRIVERAEPVSSPHFSTYDTLINKKDYNMNDEEEIKNIVKKQVKNLGKLLNSGTREAAFVHAISSAGLAYSITRACSQGKLSRCGCDMSMPENVPSYNSVELHNKYLIPGHFDKDLLIGDSRESHFSKISDNSINKQLIIENMSNKRFRRSINPSNYKGMYSHYNLINTKVYRPTNANRLSQNINDKFKLDMNKPQSNYFNGNNVIPNKNKFFWAGCSDNTAFGLAFAQNFIETREELNFKRKKRNYYNKLKVNSIKFNHSTDGYYRGDSFKQWYEIDKYVNNVVKPNDGKIETRLEELGAKVLTNLHNSGAGRKAVELAVHTYCKCHGASGSCELKTCWRALPSSFTTIGKVLKVKFDGATEVKLKFEGKPHDRQERSDI